MCVCVLSMVFAYKIQTMQAAAQLATPRGCSKHYAVCTATSVTPCSARLFLSSPVLHRHYVMFVGNTGTGKTANIMSKLSRMDPEAMMFTTINMNTIIIIRINTNEK